MDIGCPIVTKTVTRQTIFVWLSCLIVLSLVILFSSVSKPTFATHYRTAIDLLPFPAAMQKYLLSHYKLGHPLCYAILAMVASFCLKGRYLLTILLVFSLGAAMEVVQYFLPTRAASLMDMGYNLAGVLAGVAVVSFLKILSSESHGPVSDPDAQITG